MFSNYVDLNSVRFIVLSSTWTSVTEESGVRDSPLKEGPRDTTVGTLNGNLSQRKLNRRSRFVLYEHIHVHVHTLV